MSSLMHQNHRNMFTGSGDSSLKKVAASNKRKSHANMIDFEEGESPELAPDVVEIGGESQAISAGNSAPHESPMEPCEGTEVPVDLEAQSDAQNWPAANPSKALLSHKPEAPLPSMSTLQAGTDTAKVHPGEVFAEGTVSTLASILRAALVKNTNSILARAYDFIGDPQKHNGRYKRLKRIQEEEDQLSKDTQLVLEYIASEDITFILQDLSTDIILESMIRRTAWKKHFGVMVLMSIGQIAMCVIAILTVNQPMNLSTLAIAAVYIVCISTANPFHVTRDLSAIVLKKIDKVKVKYGSLVRAVAVLFALPVIVVVFVCGALFDFLVGRVIDNSYEGAVNIIVNAIVVSTGVSVGLRSGGPVGAIQTFAGFSFIASVDEEFMARFKFDPYEAWIVPTRKQANKIKLVSRSFMYTLVPVIFLCVLYVTLTNNCIVFCGTQQNSITVGIGF